MLLGPHGSHLLSRAVVDRAEPLVSVALAVLGVFVGVGTTTIPRGAARDAYLAGGLGAVLTTAIVAGGLWPLLVSWAVPLPIPVVACAVFLGLTASASAVAHAGRTEAARRVTHMADVDDVPLIVLGTVAIAWLATGDGAPVSWRMAMTVASGAGIGLAGWLLFERASGTPERGVRHRRHPADGWHRHVSRHVAAADRLRRRAGLVRAPGEADRIGIADLRVIQHPLLALLLIVAGASIEWTLVVVWAAVATVLLRLVGKIVASVAVAPIVGVRPGVLATALLPPGVLGIALALNASQILGGDSYVLVGIATTAAAASEGLAMFMPGDLEDGR